VGKMKDIENDAIEVTDMWQKPRSKLLYTETYSHDS